MKKAIISDSEHTYDLVNNWSSRKGCFNRDNFTIYNL